MSKEAMYFRSWWCIVNEPYLSTSSSPPFKVPFVCYYLKMIHKRAIFSVDSCNVFIRSKREDAERPSCSTVPRRFILLT